MVAEYLPTPHERVISRAGRRLSQTGRRGGAKTESPAHQPSGGSPREAEAIA